MPRRNPARPTWVRSPRRQSLPPPPSPSNSVRPGARGRRPTCPSPIARRRRAWNALMGARDAGQSRSAPSPGTVADRMAHPDRFLLAGLMGSPVMHSRSPQIHNYWLKQHGLAGTYVPLAIKVEGLRAALRALPALGFSGCNLTLPHKVAALGIVDPPDPLARRIGAVNTIVVAPDGSLDGQNTDAFGYVESIREAQPAWRADAGPIVVIGAGGGARAVLVSL